MFEMTPPPAPKPKKRGGDDDPDFTAFWSAYPRKVDKGHGRTAWVKALKTGADPAAIIAAAQGFAELHARERTETKFIAMPATWLNGERWADERAAPTNGRSGPFRNPADPNAAYASGGL